MSFTEETEQGAGVGEGAGGDEGVSRCGSP